MSGNKGSQTLKQVVLRGGEFSILGDIPRSPGQGPERPNST